MMNEAVEMVTRQVVLGKEFTIYGTAEEPLFLAKDVAKWIDYSEGNVSKMVSNIDDDEKTTLTIVTSGSQTTNAIFLTENGVYKAASTSKMLFSTAAKVLGYSMDVNKLNGLLKKLVGMGILKNYKVTPRGVDFEVNK